MPRPGLRSTSAPATRGRQECLPHQCLPHDTVDSRATISDERRPAIPPSTLHSSPMYTPAEIVAMLEQLAVTHVVWLPDSELGQWESALEADPLITLIRVAREGEAWQIAAGLHLGGR